MSTKNKNVIYLDRNENQYGPSRSCYKILWKSNHKTLNTYSRDFTRGVNSILSERLAKDYGIEEKRILLGYGSEDILKQCVQCYINKGDKIMLPSYSWWYYKKIADEAEGVNIFYPLVEGEDTFSYDIESMLRVYEEQKPRLVLISSPNNPTGNRLLPDQLNYILERIKESIVVLDEAYSLFDRDYNLDPAELVQKFPQLIIIRTFSKYYGLAGIRTGYAFLGKNHKQLALINARYLGFNRLSERIAIAALDSKRYYILMREKMAADMEMLYIEMNKLPGFLAYRSYANFILVKIPFEIKEPLQKYLIENNLIVKFMNEDGLNNHIRITLGTHKQNCKLLRLIKSFMNVKNLS
jgi:histidinol-phosphate aminotransferase